MKKFLALTMAVLMVLSLAACGGNTDPSAPVSDAPVSDAPASNAPAEGSDLAYVQDKGTLVIGITDFAPMDYQDANGEWIGFDADMAVKFAESLGVKPQFQIITDWDAKVMELESKTVDVV